MNEEAGRKRSYNESIIEAITPGEAKDIVAFWDGGCEGGFPSKVSTVAEHDYENPGAQPKIVFVVGSYFGPDLNDELVNQLREKK